MSTRTIRSLTAAAAVFGFAFSAPLLTTAASADTSRVTATCKGETATFVGTAGRDVFDGGPGRDVVVALGGNDDIDAGGGDDLVCAGAGNDEIDGDAGNDVMFGQGGDDEMDGQTGDDTLIGNKGRDDADGEVGFDTCAAEHEEQCEA